MSFNLFFLQFSSQYLQNIMTCISTSVFCITDKCLALEVLKTVFEYCVVGNMIQKIMFKTFELDGLLEVKIPYSGLKEKEMHHLHYFLILIATR